MRGDDYLIRVGLKEEILGWGAPSTAFAEFRIFRMPVAADAKPEATVLALPEDFGLRDFSSKSIDRFARKPELMRHAPAQVEALVKKFYEDGTVAWWQLEDSSGCLAGMPWEQLLWSVGKVPSIRQNAGGVSLGQPRNSFDVLLCLSCTQTKADAERVVREFLRMLHSARQSTRIHIFADQRVREILHRRIDFFAQRGFTVNIAEPKQTDFDLGENGVASNQNPWLEWMQRELKPYAVDYAHFVCHGRLQNESAGLLFAEPIVTEDERWAVPVGARGLNAFLTSVGAWSVSFSSPRRNPSPAGLRLFTHQLARLRTGPVILQEMKHDRRGDDLRRAIRYCTDGAPYSGSPGIVLYWNSDRTNHDIVPNVAGSPSNAETYIAPIVRLQRSLEANLSEALMAPLETRRKIKTLAVKRSAKVLRSANVLRGRRGK